MKFLFRQFGTVYRFDRWVRRRLTGAGLLLIAALVGSGVFGADTRQSAAYQVFALVGGLLLVAVITGRPPRRGLRLSRELPEFATVGEPLEYTVILENGTGRAQAGLVLREELAERLPSFEEFDKARVPGDDERNWFDRRIGYPRWLWLVHRRRGANIRPVAVPPLPADEAAQLAVTLTPLRRGALHFRQASVARPDPLGIYLGSASIGSTASLLVLPRRYPVPPLALPGVRRYQRGGLALASRVGDAEEFVGLRDYRPGDPLRRIHWKSWARAGKPIVKEYQDEFFVRHGLVLDNFAREGDDEILEGAISAAASLACTVRSQESLLDLMFVGAEAYCFTAGRGLADTAALLRVLAAVEARRDGEFDMLARAVVARAGILSGCICVLLAWDEQRQEFVRQLSGLGVPLLVLVVVPGGEPAGAEQGGFRVLRSDRLAEDLARL